MTTVYDFTAARLEGETEPLSTYKDSVLLIVNTASKCGFTPQYAGLEALQKQFASRKFSVLGFPCNQFGNQEPGDASAIGGFCQRNYGVSFPMFAKIEVNGDAAHPLYKFLKAEKPGLLGLQGIKWNFTKFLIDRAGNVLERFGPLTKPASVGGRIERLLA